MKVKGFDYRICCENFIDMWWHRSWDAFLFTYITLDGSPNLDVQKTLPKFDM